MRILVVSDLHANFAALCAVSRAAQGQYDVCLCLGDVVEYGPDPGACIDWARANAKLTVRGNHDHGTAHAVAASGVSGFRYLTAATREWTAGQISPEQRRWLAALPTTRLVKLGRHTFFLAHASPRDPLDEYVPPDASAWAPRVTPSSVGPADFVLVGHTHVPLVLNVGRVTVVNPGSVGLARDGNPHARYALIDDGKVTLAEVPYDTGRTRRAVELAGIEPQAKAMLSDIYQFGRYVHPPGLPLPRPSGPFAVTPLAGAAPLTVVG